ncbi:hypothetical protein ACPYPG_20300 [Streptomyces sp. FR-108]|uniref:hypothetical protein n=1 Tax=Streptomyces sp. FR-108 TaxID=3416665 RepID=UPI003CF655FB
MAVHRRAQALQEARRTSALVRRELGVLLRRSEEMDAKIEKITARHSSAEESQPSEEDYYLVFKKAIDGNYPDAHQFGDAVEATFGFLVPDDEANRLVNRFITRHVAELQEDHIA